MELGCSICQDCFLPNVDCDATTCGHVFHKACLAPWIQLNATCPTCRAHCTRHSLIRIFFTMNPSEQGIKTDELLNKLTEAGQRERKLKDDLALANNKIKELEQKVRGATTTTTTNQTVRNSRQQQVPTKATTPQKQSPAVVSNAIPVYRIGGIRVVQPPPPSSPVRQSNRFRSPSAEGIQINNIKLLGAGSVCCPHSGGLPEKVILLYSIGNRRERSTYSFARHADPQEPFEGGIVANFQMKGQFRPYRDHYNRRLRAVVSCETMRKYPSLHLPRSVVLHLTGGDYGSNEFHRLYTHYEVLDVDYLLPDY